MSDPQLTVENSSPNDIAEFFTMLDVDDDLFKLGGDELFQSNIFRAQMLKQYSHTVKWSCDGPDREVKPAKDLAGEEVASWNFLGDWVQPPGMRSSCRVGDGWGVMLGILTNQDFRLLDSIEVFARTPELADEMITYFREQLDGDLPSLRDETDRSHVVPFQFWRAGFHGAKVSYREIQVPLWEEIEVNYAAEVQGRYSELAKISAPDPNGPRIILMHGPAGTGKTTMIRALANQWREWADFHCVIDPESLWNDPNYLFDIAMGPVEEKWRILVMEDSGELLSAKEGHAGQALARLLNMADGILGQGMKIMFLITSNEKITELHPAVSRPGRCLAKIEVGKLNTEECAKWLKTNDVKHAVQWAHSLAELFAIKNDKPLRGHTIEEDYAGGTYL